MQVDRWPIAGREQLVRAFRPGEQPTKEAPFRTLRAHGWATAGVRVVTRKDHRASGRLSIFSVLNVDAARLAREGSHRWAGSMAKAAAGIERSREFHRLVLLLSGGQLEELTAVVEGDVAGWPELHELLQAIAHATSAARKRLPSTALPEVVAGQISEERTGFLVLTDAHGVQTAVPRWLAQAAHRQHVGDYLALVTDKLDDQQMVINAVPGIETGGRAPFTPFGRKAPVHSLARADARKLSRTPAPPHVLVPVVIGS